MKKIAQMLKASRDFDIYRSLRIPTERIGSQNIGDPLIKKLDYSRV